MKWLINYIRSCFCNHEWELLMEIYNYSSKFNDMPTNIIIIYRCKKCGFVQKIEC